MGERVAVVGAGVGGLATAARLARKGYEVDVYEKLPECGGRAHLIEDKGFKFDTGPSFVLMPDFFSEPFEYCGEKMSDYLDLKALETRYRIFYDDGRVLNFYKDFDRTKSELERFEPGAGAAFARFVAETGRIYGLTRPLLYRCATPGDLKDPSFLKLAFQIKVFSSYWKLAKGFFKSDDLCYALTFEAMFMGVSPFETPAFYSIISYADHVQKIFHPMGGMYQIPLALERMAKKFGARFHYNTEIKRVQKEGGGFVLRGSRYQEFAAERVVINADLAFAQSQLLGRRLPRYKYSCSVYLLYLGMKTKVKGLDHHNIFFPRDVNKNLNDVFKGGVVADDPSFYIHVPTVTDPSLAPAGKDIVYVLVPVPNMEATKSDGVAREEELRAAVFERVRRHTGADLRSLIEVEHRFYPSDFIRRYNIVNAATFGLAHNLFQSAFFRPANRDPVCPGLYFVGASTQPGGGLPPVLASSRIVADLMTGEDA